VCKSCRPCSHLVLVTAMSPARLFASRSGRCCVLYTSAAPRDALDDCGTRRPADVSTPAGESYHKDDEIIIGLICRINARQHEITSDQKQIFFS